MLVDTATLTTLPVELPRLDGDTQSRLAIDEDTVASYAEAIETADGAWPFPVIDLFHDGTDFWPGDGHHRILAALRTKRGSIPCRVYEGTERDARLHGMTANDRHGLRMSRADKRLNIEWLLDGGEMTQTQIAEAAGVGRRLVQEVVLARKHDVLAKLPTPPKRLDAAQNVQVTPESGESKLGAITETPEPPKRNGQPPKQYDGAFWLKQWDQAIGPLARLVDKIAAGVGRSGCESHQLVQDHLNNATEVMPELLGDDTPAGRCPVCSATKWAKDGDGFWTCAKCNQPWGEPAGDPSVEHQRTLRQKCVKTAEALMRCLDDIQHVAPEPAEHAEDIDRCKAIMRRQKSR